MNEPRRWRLREGDAPPFPSYDWIEGDAIFEDGEEVMPVSEHERWREAFLEGQRADHARCQQFRRALEWIAEYGSRDGDLKEGWEDAMRNIARNTVAPGQKERSDG